jgi:hypothetical protein
MGWWRRFFNGLLSKDKSLATGLILGFMAWTLMRLVDGITANGTIEYDISNSPATLADGRPGYLVRVTLTNLSADTALINLRASIAASTADIVFSVDPKDRSCAFEPPGWGGQPTCDAFASGFDFLAPMIVAGTQVEFEVKYTRPDSASALPIVRIKPETTKFRLVEPGFSTFVARNQVGILLTLLLLALVTLFLSVAAGVPKGGPHA